MLLHRFAPPQACALDLCGGKGGDLLKFKKAAVRALVLADHASQSVKDAVQRYNEQTPLPFPATFVCADCHSVRLSSALPADLLFDFVSCQFALHYSFESEARAKTFAANIAERLRPGGTFVATFPSAEVLQAKLRASVDAQRQKASARRAQGDSNHNPPLRLEFGNNFYSVKFTSPCPLVEQQSAASAATDATAAAASSSSSLPPLPPLPASPFGVQYSFDLEDAISDCPEYLVSLPTLQSLLSPYDCELIYDRGLHAFFLDHCSDPEYGRLLRQMKVLGAEPYDRPLTAAEWEAIGVYRAVAFRRRMPGEVPGSYRDCSTAAAPALAGRSHAVDPSDPRAQRSRAEDEQRQHQGPLSKVSIKDIIVIHTPTQTATAGAAAAAASADTLMS